MPEVYSEENKEYYRIHNSKGEKSSTALFTDEEVIALRTRYMTQTADSLYPEYKDRVSYSAFKHILSGDTYSELPFYSKKKKQWFYNGERPAKEGNRGQHRQTGNLTEEQVLAYREEYIDKTAKEVFENHPEANLSFDSFQKMLTGRTYVNIPYYSKKLQKWISK